MNRDKIDFTKTGKCCLCGAEKDECLSPATVEKFSTRKKIMKVRTVEAAKA